MHGRRSNVCWRYSTISTLDANTKLILRVTKAELCRSAISVVLSALPMKIQVFWDVNRLDCLPVDVSQSPRSLESRQ